MSLVQGKQLAVTLDETPDVRGRPAVCVLFTFMHEGSGQCSRKTVAAELHILPKCNAMSVSCFARGADKKHGMPLKDISALVIDSPSYVQKLHCDLKTCAEYEAIAIRGF